VHPGAVDDSTRTPSRRRLAWAVPGAVLVVVAAGAVALNGSVADASPNLPARTPEQLITAVLSSSTRALSGTVTQTSDLGLPELPGGASQASLSWQQFLTGTNTAQVWIDGPDRQRLAVTAPLSEADVVHHGRDVWTYTSEDDTVSHTVLPDGRPGAADPTAVLTPTAAAQQALAAIDSTTVVSVADTARVAGRPVYTLQLAPRDARSTVREVAISVDSATGVPLRLEVYGAAAAPAFQVGFTSVDFSTPAASRFTFTAPPGAKVTDHPFGGAPGGPEAAPGPGGAEPTATGAPTVIGTGWTSVVEIPGAGDLLQAGGGVLDQLTTTLPSGGRLLHTALVNAVLLPDGRAFVGAVGPDLLEQIAANH
jgi:outer membrane lipoprotein-sorting protein